MKRPTKIAIAVVIAAQFAAIAIYMWVESERVKPLSTEAPRQIDRSVDSFVVVSRDGLKNDLVGGDKPVLVHFWATWCKPCIDELPLLLELPDDKVRVVAVALDDDWQQIESFVAPNPRIVRADAQTAEVVFEIPSLPQTYLLTGDGRLTLSANGAKNWADPVFWKYWTK